MKTSTLLLSVCLALGLGTAGAYAQTTTGGSTAAPAATSNTSNTSMQNGTTMTDASASDTTTMHRKHHRRHHRKHHRHHHMTSDNGSTSAADIKTGPSGVTTPPSMPSATPMPGQ